MEEVFELRKKPELKIILRVSRFDIFDNYNSQNNKSYLYNSIERIQLNKEKTNWFISVLSIIVDLFSGIGYGGKFKTKAYLKVDFKEGQALKIWLIDADFELTQQAVQSIAAKISS
jgi:hypothetical protein